jgi:hypothetical protein
MEIQGDEEFQRVWGFALKNLARKYQKPKLLIDSFGDAPHLLMRNDELKKTPGVLARSGPDMGRTRDIVSFSPVGFDRRKTHAIVTIGVICGTLCGHESPHFFERRNGEWTEVSVSAIRTEWFI